MKPFIFCVTVNCAKVTAVMLESFHKHHPDEVMHILGTKMDFEQLHEIMAPDYFFPSYYHNIENYDWVTKFSQGHAGTAAAFAAVIQQKLGHTYDSFIHIDSDVFFKKESISVIKKAFDEGFDIVGTRRCFKNNPSGIKGLDNLPDTISTFFFGMKLDKIPNFSFEDLCRICEGALHPIE